MAAADIPPTPFVLRIPGVKGDPATGGFNVQSFNLTAERSLDTTSRDSRRSMTLTRVVDDASPTISIAFALRRTVATDVTVVALDAAGGEVVSYLIKDPKVARYEVSATVGGNECATETVVLEPSQMTVTVAKSKRSSVI